MFYQTVMAHYAVAGKAAEGYQSDAAPEQGWQLCRDDAARGGF